MKLNKKGFSLVELLAAIVILAIMMSLATAAYSRYRQKAKQQGYDTLAQSASDAAAEYAMDHQGTYKVSFEELYEQEYISSLQDPGVKEKNCTGNVILNTTTNKEKGSLDTEEYSVNLCCKNYNYLYSFPSGEKQKQSSCGVSVNDNTPPKITDKQVIYSQEKDYNTTSIDIKLGLQDETTKENQEMSVCITFDTFDKAGKCSTGWKTYSEKISVDIPSASYNGKEHKIYIKARDGALNEVKGKYTYTVYKACSKVVSQDWKDSDGQSCGACGKSTIQQEKGKVDKYLKKSCGTEKRTYNCPYPDCCSQKKIVCTKWKNSGSCSKECASGVQKQVRTCSYQSTLDSSVKCPGSTGLSESQNVLCNTKPCTPYISSTEGNVTYSCDNNETISASDRKCTLKWPSSGGGSFNVSTYKYANKTGRFYKYAYDSEKNTLLCNWITGCKTTLNNGKIYYTYKYDDGTGQSGILYVDVSK